MTTSARTAVATVVVACFSSVGRSTQSPAAPAKAIAVTDVTVIDVDRGQRLAEHTVVVKDGRIAALGPTRTTAVPAEVEVLSGRGQFLIPGLWDMHFHSALGSYEDGRGNLPRLLANGITGIRDMGAPPDDILRLRAEVRDGAMLGPRLVVAGPLLQGPLPPQLRAPLRCSMLFWPAFAASGRPVSRSVRQHFARRVTAVAGWNKYVRPGHENDRAQSGSGTIDPRGGLCEALT